MIHNNTWKYCNIAYSCIDAYVYYINDMLCYDPHSDWDYDDYDDYDYIDVVDCDWW